MGVLTGPDQRHQSVPTISVTTAVTTTANTTKTSAFGQELAAVQGMLSDQLLVSQDRCVDALLDLHNLAPTPLVRGLIGGLISDIRYVAAVEAQLLSDDLNRVTRQLGSGLGLS